MKKNISTKRFFTIMLGIMAVTIGVNGQELNDRPASQYLFGQFSTAEVVKKSGLKLTAVMNYNCLTEEMIFIQQGQRLALDNINSVDTIYLNDRIFIPSGDVFYELVTDDEACLFIQHNSTAKIDGEIVGYGETSQLSNVKTVSSLRENGQFFYMDMPENIEVNYKPVAYIGYQGEGEIFYNRRTLIKIFPDMKSQIRKYFKENRPDLEKRTDLIKLVSFINNNL